jgi:hypothetical protein
MPIASLANLQWNGPASAALVDQTEVLIDLGASGLASGVPNTQIVVLDDVRSTRLVDRPIETTIVVDGDGGSPKGRARVLFVADVAASPSAYDIAQAVHAQNLSGFNTVGSAGKYLKDAGGAGNPWNAEIASNNVEGTFGWFIQKLLTVGKFLGLK